MLKRKVCIITPVHWSHGIGGIEYQAKLLAESLAANDRVELTYLARKVSYKYRPKNYKLYEISKSKFIHRYGFFMDAFKLLSLLRNIKPDVIYENGGCSYTGIAAYYSKKRKECKSIWHVASDNDLVSKRHSSIFKPNLYFEKKILNYGIKNSDVIIAQSKYQKKILAESNERSDIYLIPNFHPYPCEDDEIIKSNQIVWIANFKKIKQPEIFIELANRLKNRKINIKCLMVGKPTAYPNGYQEKLESLIGENNKLFYLGQLPVEDVNRLIAKSKLLINTSKWEGFPNTFIQAWMRGTPVVSLHCDPDNVIRNYQDLDVSLTPDKLLEDVIALLEDSNLRNKIGNKVRNYAKSEYSIDNLKKLEKLILE